MHCSFTELLTGTRMVKSVMPRRRRARPSLLNTQLARRERVVSYSVSSVYIQVCMCRTLIFKYWYFHADIDDDLLESDQETHSRRAYGGCLLETSYMYAPLIH